MKWIVVFLGLAVAGLVSFGGRKCVYEFVAVELATVKVERPLVWNGGSVLGAWPTGLQDGKELICVKCFFKCKQVVDYGNLAPVDPELKEMLRGDGLGVARIDSARWKSVIEFLKKDGRVIWDTIGPARTGIAVPDTLKK